ncbi:MAG: acyltransferase [Candidatus Dormibacteraceae bacterium]
MCVDGFANHVAAAAWGVPVGPNCEFFGRVSFERRMGSTIRIGRACTFRSGKDSNRIGINRPCMISTLTVHARIIIGDRVAMSGTVIGAAESITIGDDVLCGANVTITDTDWHGLPADRRLLPGRSASVVIGNNVWLGLNVIVLKGVTIGSNTVVGAGSLVSKSLPENVVAGGIPAKPIKRL